MIWKTSRGQLEIIFREHAGAMLLYARSLLGEEQAAEDVVQEIFVGLISNKTVPEKPRNYLLRAVRNRVYNHRRSTPTHSLQESRLPMLFSHPLEEREQRETLSQALAQLSEEQREVVVLKIWGQLTFREIAVLADSTANTVASRYRYALGHLRKAMADYYEGARQ